MRNSLSVILICVAVIAAAVAAVWVSTSRATEARAYAEAEAAVADQKAAESRTAAKEAEAEADRRRTAEAKRAEAEADKSYAEAETERAKADQARADADKAKATAAAERDRAQAAADALELEKVKAERATAEAKSLELTKLDLETFQQELLDYKRELDERELELRPEKTINDLVWLEDEDTEIDEKGNVKRREKPPYLAENDRTLPRETRSLARLERQAKEGEATEMADVRSFVIAPLEKLYVEALRENRVIDADFYRKNIKSMYPDWEFDAAALKAAAASGGTEAKEVKQ